MYISSLILIFSDWKCLDCVPSLILHFMFEHSNLVKARFSVLHHHLGRDQKTLVSRPWGLVRDLFQLLGIWTFGSMRCQDVPQKSWWCRFGVSKVIFYNISSLAKLMAPFTILRSIEAIVQLAWLFPMTPIVNKSCKIECCITNVIRLLKICCLEV